MTLIPFLASLPGGPDDVRPLSAALPARLSAPARSPWSPQPVDPGLAALPSGAAEELLAAARVEADRLRAEATEAGRAEGLAAVAADRARLAQLVAELVGARAARDARTADAIASAAATVIEAWLGHAVTGAEKFAPLVRGWLAAGATDGAVARVHPRDLAALRAAIGEAAIAVEPDPDVAPGDLRIRAGARELDHRWADRLTELREAIATSVAADLAADAAATPAEVTP